MTDEKEDKLMLYEGEENTPKKRRGQTPAPRERGGGQAFRGASRSFTRAREKKKAKTHTVSQALAFLGVTSPTIRRAQVRRRKSILEWI